MRPTTAIFARSAGFAVVESGVATYRHACLYHQIELALNGAAENPWNGYCNVPKQNAQEWRAGNVDNSSHEHSHSFHAFRLPV
jgi:hypothetical protein